MAVLAECQEAVKIWMEKNWLHLNPNKIEWFGVFGPPSPDNIS